MGVFKQYKDTSLKPDDVIKQAHPNVAVMPYIPQSEQFYTQRLTTAQRSFFRNVQRTGAGGTNPVGPKGGKV